MNNHGKVIMPTPALLTELLHGLWMYPSNMKQLRELMKLSSDEVEAKSKLAMQQYKLQVSYMTSNKEGKDNEWHEMAALAADALQDEGIFLNRLAYQIFWNEELIKNAP